MRSSWFHILNRSQPFCVDAPDELAAERDTTDFASQRRRTEHRNPATRSARASRLPAGSVLAPMAAVALTKRPSGRAVPGRGVERAFATPPCSRGPGFTRFPGFERTGHVRQNDRRPPCPFSASADQSASGVRREASRPSWLAASVTQRKKAPAKPAWSQPRVTRLAKMGRKLLLAGALLLLCVSFAPLGAHQRLPAAGLSRCSGCFSQIRKPRLSGAAFCVLGVFVLVENRERLLIRPPANRLLFQDLLRASPLSTRHQLWMPRAPGVPPERCLISLRGLPLRALSQDGNEAFHSKHF